MPRKIENRLRQGLPSKIYWYAYPKPMTGYAIAKKVYKPIMGRPDTAKIYPYARKMVDAGELNVIDKKYQSNPEPLVIEIEKALKKHKTSLTENEKFCVLRILQNDFFKETVSFAIESEEENVRRDIDAAREISHILGVSSIVQYQTFRSAEKIVQKLANEHKTEYEGFEQSKIREYTSQDPIENFLNYLGQNLPMKLIKLLPVDLEKLWDAMEKAHMALTEKSG